MPVPKHIFDPPFNIVRSSHIALGVADLGRSRAFYAETLGLIVDDHRSRHEPIRWNLRDLAGRRCGVSRRALLV